MTEKGSNRKHGNTKIGHLNGHTSAFYHLFIETRNQEERKDGSEKSESVIQAQQSTFTLQGAFLTHWQGSTTEGYHSLAGTQQLAMDVILLCSNTEQNS